MRIRHPKGSPNGGRFVAYAQYEKWPFDENGREFKVELSPRELAELRESEQQLSLNFDEDEVDTAEPDDEDSGDTDDYPDYVGGGSGGVIPGREHELDDLDYAEPIDLAELEFAEDEIDDPTGS